MNYRVKVYDVAGEFVSIKSATFMAAVACAAELQSKYPDKVVSVYNIDRADDTDFDGLTDEEWENLP